MDTQASIPEGSQPKADEPISSVQEVFEITELLEAILLEVDDRTVLLAQRVNEHWLDTIEGSPSLQRKLGFEHDPKIAKDKDKPVDLNPLLFKPEDDDKNYCQFGRIGSGIGPEYARRSFVPLQNIVTGKLYAPRGNWRRMYVLRDGMDCSCDVSATVFTDRLGFDYKMFVSGKMDGDVTAGDLMDWILKKAERTRRKWVPNDLDYAFYLCRMRRLEEEGQEPDVLAADRARLVGRRYS